MPAPMPLPTLFISHGAPTFALEPGLLGPQLAALGRGLPRPRAVLVMSPHWMTRGVAVLANARPSTMHDFGGFPQSLHALEYDAPGAPDVALEVTAMLGRHGMEATSEPLRGRDHGAWVPLLHLYPAADIPAIQVSQPAIPSPLALLELGQALAPLRERGVLVVASGSLTHNLDDVRGDAAERAEPAYARSFADWMWSRIEEGDLGALLDYRKRAPYAARAHPTDEHLLPLFFAIGAAGADWALTRRLVGGLTYGVLAMDSFVFGAPCNSLFPAPAAA